MALSDLLIDGQSGIRLVRAEEEIDIFGSVGWGWIGLSWICS